INTLNNEERRIIQKDIAAKSNLPNLSKIKPVTIQPSIVDVPDKKAGKSKAAPRKPYKPDYAMRENRNRIVGRHAETVVVKYEQNKLIDNGRVDLADSVDHIADYDDSVGYDVLSYDADSETEKHIEVKAVKDYRTEFVFYISQNEIDKAKADPNYHIYIVF